MAKEEPWPDTRLKAETHWADVSVFLSPGVQTEKGKHRLKEG